jgi:pimeloyl-ACP methyl ester carboxylesterase
VNSRAIRFASLVLMNWLSACAWMYPTAVPVHVLPYPAAATGRASTLLVLLPGRGNKADEFAHEGFIAEVRTAQPALDIVAVDAHLGYYLNESVVDRVWADVIAPARAQGYQRIWLAGISMGGLGAVAIAQQHPEAIDRVILLAPYLGPKSLMAEIDRQGGVQRWRAKDPADIYQRLWLWLQQYGHPGEKKLPELLLGFGSGDRLHATHQLLAAVLPPAQVLEISGGHDWSTWRKLWHQYWSAVPT